MTTEKKIDKAAIKYQSQSVNNMAIEKAAFIEGAMSDAARDYWLQKLSEKFESKSDNETVAVIEIVNKVLKSDMAKEYHTKGMFTQEQVFKLLKESQYAYHKHQHPESIFDLKQWFYDNAKTV